LTALGLWIAAGLTLCIYSFLYKDNPFFKFAEHLFVGVSAGYLLTITFHDNFIPYIYDPLKSVFTEGKYGELSILIPAILGMMMFAQFTQKYSWLVRIPFAFMVGYYAGASITPGMQADIFEQIRGTAEPFGTMETAYAIINAILILVGVICTLMFFFFSKEHKGFVGGVSEVGIVFLMIGFGAAFGYTVMSRISLLIGRIDFLLNLPLINSILPK
jgi:hypothetical protein